MRTVRYAIAGIALACGTGLPVAGIAADSWTTTANTEFRYFSSRNSLGATASQLSAPLGVQTSGPLSPDWKASFLVRTGYLYSQQNSGTTASTVSILTDTSVSPTVTYLGWNGITPTL